MKKLIAILGLTLLACSTPSGGPAPAPAATQAPATATKGLLPQQDEDRKDTPPSVKPFPARKDPRSPTENAAAACTGPSGENRCPSVKRLLTASPSSNPIVPASWTVPSWYIDFANTLGCASDSNSGTSATCTGGCAGSVCQGGVGPLLTAGEWLQHRLGTRSPTFQSATGVVTLNVLSSQPLASATADPFGTFAPTSPMGSFQLIGKLQNVGSTCTAGAITQITRANPGNDFSVAAGTCTFVAGQVVFDSTVSGGSYAYVNTVSGGNATLTQPFAAAGMTTPSNDPTFTVDGASWTVGDTLQLSTPPVIYMDQFAPTAGSSSGFAAGDTAGSTWVSAIDFGDGSGLGPSARVSTVTIYPTGAFFMTLVRADAAVVINASAQAESAGNGGVVNSGVANCWFQDGGEFGRGYFVFYGGALGTTAGGVAFNNQVVVKNDTIVLGPEALIFNQWMQVYNMHITGGNTAVEEPSASVVLRSSGTNGVLWGNATFKAYQFSSVVNRTGGTWANNVILNALQLTSNSLTTGYTPPVGGTFTNNGVTQVDTAGAFPINATIAFSLATAGGTPCTALPYFSAANTAGNFFTKNTTASCNDIYNWQAQPTGGVALTSANIDTYGALYDPASGARFTN
jgi:hypothetical protein